MRYEFILFSHLYFLVHSLKGYGDFPLGPVHLPPLSSQSCAIAVAVRERGHVVSLPPSLPLAAAAASACGVEQRRARRPRQTSLSLGPLTERRVRARDASPLLSSFVHRPPPSFHM